MDSLEDLFAGFESDDSVGISDTDVADMLRMPQDKFDAIVRVAVQVHQMLHNHSLPQFLGEEADPHSVQAEKASTDGQPSAVMVREVEQAATVATCLVTTVRRSFLKFDDSKFYAALKDITIRAVESRSWSSSSAPSAGEAHDFRRAFSDVSTALQQWVRQGSPHSTFGEAVRFSGYSMPGELGVWEALVATLDEEKHVVATHLEVSEAIVEAQNDLSGIGFTNEGSMRGADSQFTALRLAEAIPSAHQTALGRAVTNTTPTQMLHGVYTMRTGLLLRPGSAEMVVGGRPLGGLQSVLSAPETMTSAFARHVAKRIHQAHIFIEHLLEREMVSVLRRHGIDHGTLIRPVALISAVRRVNTRPVTCHPCWAVPGAQNREAANSAWIRFCHSLPPRCSCFACLYGVCAVGDQPVAHVLLASMVYYCMCSRWTSHSAAG